MTKEHKKMYKAGKNWIAATITVATVAVFGGLATLNAHADSTTQVQKINSSITNQNPTNVTTQGSQINNVNEKQSVNNSKSNSQADNYNLTTAGSNNQSSENNNSNLQSSMSNGSQTTTATSTHTKNSDGLDPNIYGTVNVKDWDYQENNHVLNLTNYHGQDKDRIIIPNLNDFSNANVDIAGTTEVGITSTVMHNTLCATRTPNADLNIAISKTTGIHSDKVIAENENWAGVFCPYNLTYKNGKPELIGPNQFTLINADLTNLDISKVTNIAFLFDNQRKLQNVSGLNGWKTSNITDMSAAFGACWALRNIDLSSWDTSNVINMSGMFGSSGLESLTTIKNWDTSKV